MPERTLEKYRQAAKELRRHLNSQQYRTRAPEKAFVEWYILARFGGVDGTRFLDGKKDGGIDALVENDGTTFLIQSKYEVRPRVSAVSRNEIAGFERVSSRFRDRAAEKDFQAWLQTVRPQLRATYKGVRKRAIRRPDAVRFIFVTTKRFRLEESELAEVEDVQKIASLWYLYAEGFTPPTEYVELRLESAWHTSSERDDFKTYVGLAEVRDFLRLMDDDKNERLFAQNVRTDLRSSINREIRKTYEGNPDDFWLGNNGIYIVCKKVVPSGSTYRLVYPSIINGSQTLHSVYSSGRRHSCSILVRILEMDVVGNPGLLSEVIRRTNTQNPMKLINLCAHDPFQLNVARFLDRYRIFYERREKEWANEKKAVLLDYHHVATKDVAQWLSTLKSDIGFGRARSRVSELFQSELYRKIFGDFDRELRSHAYSDLTIMCWSGMLVRNLLYYLPKRTRTYAKISQLLLVRAIYEAVARAKGRLGADVQKMLEDHRVGARRIPQRLVKVAKGAIKDFVTLQKKAQRRDPNIDFSNFFKRDDFSRSAYRRCFGPARIKKLSTAISQSLHAID